MKHRRTLLVLLSALAPCVAAEKGAAQDLDVKLLAAGCYGCHPRAGGEQAGMADLAQFTAREMTDRLLAYRRDSLAATVMHRIARGYTEPELESLANHLARPSP